MTPSRRHYYIFCSGNITFRIPRSILNKKKSNIHTLPKMRTGVRLGTLPSIAKVKFSMKVRNFFQSYHSKFQANLLQQVCSLFCCNRSERNLVEAVTFHYTLFGRLNRMSMLYDRCLLFRVHVQDYRPRLFIAYYKI